MQEATTMHQFDIRFSTYSVALGILSEYGECLLRDFMRLHSSVSPSKHLQPVRCGKCQWGHRIADKLPEPAFGLRRQSRPEASWLKSPMSRYLMWQ